MMARGGSIRRSRTELTALFESDAMLQVQADAYVQLLLRVRGELQRIFPEAR